jgi:non-specific protein-tyrosine kinase
MELLHYWNLIRKRSWLIIAIVCVAMVGAGYYVLKQPPLYRTNSTLVINPATLDSTVNYQLSDGMLPLANTYAEFMQSRSFARSVSMQLQAQGLADIPSEDEILNAIIAHYIDGTQLFRITATYRDPAMAQALANTTAQMLVAANDARIQAQQTALINAQLDTRRVQEIDRLGELTNLLRDELQYYEDRIQSLERQLTVLSGGPQSVATDAKILETRDELLASRSARVELLGSLANAQQALLTETEKANNNIDTVVIVDEAILPTEALPRNIHQPLLAALAAAIALGVVLAVGLEYVDSSVKSPEELDRFYGMPSLGAIGIIGKLNDSQDPADSLIMLHAPHTPIAETIRVLRTAVQMVSIDRPLRSLLITSARLGEGKTFIATNLAISIAQAGKRVILVDADLRRPQLHRVFGIRNAPGFTNLVVEDNLAVAQVLQPTRVPNLRILASGTLSPNPAELLSSDRASALVKSLVEHADIVLYDSSPATTVTDAVILAPQVDGVVQVVSARGTRIDLVRRCKELLERSGARVIGPVLNRVPVADLGYYSNYYQEGRHYTSGHKAKGNGADLAWLDSAPAQRRRQRNEQVSATADSQARASNGYKHGTVAPDVRIKGQPFKPEEDQ